MLVSKFRHQTATIPNAMPSTQIETTLRSPSYACIAPPEILRTRSLSAASVGHVAFPERGRITGCNCRSARSDCGSRPVLRVITLGVGTPSNPT
jgi:hypothetical protein